MPFSQLLENNRQKLDFPRAHTLSYFFKVSPFKLFLYFWLWDFLASRKHWLPGAGEFYRYSFSLFIDNFLNDTIQLAQFPSAP